MTWKTVTNPSAGTAAKFGGADMNKISNLFSGTDVDDVDINSDWKFRSGRHRQADSDNTHYYLTIGSNLSANRNVTEPLLTADDTRVYQAHTQTLTNKTIDLTTNSLALRQFTAQVTKKDSTYYARAFDGSLIDSGDVFEEVGQAAIDYKAGDIVIGGVDPVNTEFNIDSTGLVISDQNVGTNLIINKANIVVPEGYTGNAIYMHNAAYSNISNYGFIYESGTEGATPRNWTGLKMEADDGDSCAYNTINFYAGAGIFDVGTAIEIKATSSGFVQANSFNDLSLQNYEVGVDFNSVTSGSLGGNMFNGCVFQCATYTTHAVKDVDNGGDNTPNVFNGCIVWDLPGGGKGITILSGGIVSIEGGKMQYADADDASTTTMVNDTTYGVKIPNSKNINLNTGTGTKIGTSTSQKLAFFNATPVSQRSGISNVDSSTVDNTYGAEEAAVLGSVRTKLNSVLQVLEDMGITAVA